MRFIKPSKGGGSLPTLTTPATAADIFSGKQAIDQNGNILNGMLDNSEVSTKGGVGLPIEWKLNAGGNNCANLINTLGNATAADVASGKTFSTDSGTLTGTGEIGNPAQYEYVGKLNKNIVSKTVETIPKYIQIGTMTTKNVYAFSNGVLNILEDNITNAYGSNPNLVTVDTSTNTLNFRKVNDSEIGHIDTYVWLYY